MSTPPFEDVPTRPSRPVMVVADGAVAGAIAAASAARPRLTVGVWVDDQLSQIDRPYARKLKVLGITEACLMVNASNTRKRDVPWKLRASPRAFAQAAAALRDEGLDVALTCWPRPSVKQNAELAEDMGELVRLTGAVALEVDCEANWRTAFLEGYEDMAEASRALADVLRGVMGDRGRIEMTTFAQHRENAAGAHLAPLVDVCFPQAYSVRERDGALIPWDHPFGPGHMQTLSHVGAVKAGARTIGLGLAAYEQSWPRHTPDEAMRVALERARELGVDHVRYWSSKWIVGARAQPYPKRVITAATTAG